jgi:hypothetical protein
MRKTILLETLMLSSVRLLDLKHKDLSNKKLLNIVLNFLPEETRKSGKAREYFEKAMLSPENFNELSEDEKSIYVDLVKTILFIIRPCRKKGLLEPKYESLIGN